LQADKLENRDRLNSNLLAEESKSIAPYDRNIQVEQPSDSAQKVNEKWKAKALLDWATTKAKGIGSSIGGYASTIGKAATDQWGKVTGGAKNLKDSMSDWWYYRMALLNCHGGSSSGSFEDCVNGIKQKYGASSAKKSNEQQ